MKFKNSLFGVLFSRNRLEIIRFLLKHEAAMSEREIASVLKVSHMSVNRILRELAGTDLVEFSVIGKAHVWKVNRGSYAFRVLSRLIEDADKIKEPLDDLRDLILKHVPGKLVKKIILFGSVARGQENEHSDIDIFFLVGDEKDKARLESPLRLLSAACFEAYGNKVSPYVATEEEMRRKGDLRLFAEMEKGMQLYPELR